MKNTFIALFALSLSSFGQDLYLSKSISIETDVGITRFPVGTLLMKEGEKYRVGRHLLVVPPESITTKIVVAPVGISAKVAATPKPTPKPEEPRVTLRVPEPRVTLRTSELQPSRALNK